MVEAIFLLCAISPGYMTSGLQEQYMKQLRRVAPFAYIKTLTRTAGGRPIVAIQLGCGCTKVKHRRSTGRLLHLRQISRRSSSPPDGRQICAASI